MRENRPSFTAAWVAALRSIGVFLPDPLRLVDDPYGVRFGSPLVQSLRKTPVAEGRARAIAPLWLRGGLRRFAVYMQVRTRVIDDDVEAFALAGGRQLVLLGAGFDSRAWRLAALSGATVFEVDHPATQSKKRDLMAGEQTRARVVFVPWDFEHEPLEALPQRLKSVGHDDRSATMTILEGVTMYLSESALDGTFACIASYSADGSPLALTYFDRKFIQDRRRAWFNQSVAARAVGEPFRSGFDPVRLPEWLAQRSFRLERDESAAQAAIRLVGADAARRWATRRASLSHFALARRAHLP